MEKHCFNDFIPIDTSPSLISRLVEMYASKSLERASVLEKIDQLEGDIANRKLIDQAKRHLMKKWNLSEDQAYKILRKRSMDQCKSIPNIAQDILTHSG
jgi:response regulator NasT